ncbi:hypothetical protein C448_05353 [Halococcus morrhuae DSM 1307]|uniref:Uncharacterized protein n=1 Tax=Halococcus morrhuae DSM 1307 TaxID=931277 RepID=M0MPR7_HALMO|nr:hypothetical protein C448_05353 [Halococcus morrhuae DSM 1307]
MRIAGQHPVYLVDEEMRIVLVDEIVECLHRLRAEILPRRIARVREDDESSFRLHRFCDSVDREVPFWRFGSNFTNLSNRLGDAHKRLVGRRDDDSMVPFTQKRHEREKICLLRSTGENDFLSITVIALSDFRSKFRSSVSRNDVSEFIYVEIEPVGRETSNAAFGEHQISV